MKARFITRWFRLTGTAVLLCVLAAARGERCAAQDVDFGSSDDPREQLQRVWWRYQSSLDATAGLSLISDQWRAGAAGSLNLVTRSLTARLSGSVRGGIYGRYGPDADETYDALRLVEFARINPSPRSRIYLRAGLIERMRLGTGHVVNFFKSKTAWDERTVGVEAMYGTGLMDLAGFTDNVLLDAVVGGRAVLRPLAFRDDLSLRSLALGFTYVTDLRSRRPDAPGLTAYNVDVSLNALGSGDVRLVPYGTFAWYRDFGSGIGAGASIESDNFIDLARFRLRMTLYYNGRHFIPGYVGAFYPVSSPYAGILDSKKYLEGETEIDVQSVGLEDALGGNDFETELRILIFERFELWYQFRRHYGSQNLSEYHLRLFFHQPNRLRVDVGVDRAGLKGFFSLFNRLGDRTALVFGTDYRMAGPFWIFIHARYTFERVGVDDGRELYLVQRRFEPFTGIRFDL